MNILKSDLFGLHNKQPQPANGDFIIAEPFMADRVFNRSAVFLANYEEKGSMGLIMNRPTEFSLSDVVQGIYNENIPLFYGGPTSNDRLFFLHTIGNLIPNSTEIIDDVYINGDLNIIKDYINSGEQTDGKIRFFIGCSGWTEKQLDKELNSFSWAVLKEKQNNFAEYLTGEGNEYWIKRVQELGTKYKKWLLCPSSPYLN